jgi:hypothetical protein
MFVRKSLIVAAFLTGSLSLGASAQELPYKRGPVTMVSSIRVQEGQFFEYWHFLETRWHPVMEEAKKQGLVVSYAVLESDPRTPEDPNLYLIVSYPNYAALDTIEAKESAIEKQLFGLTPQKAEQQSGERAPVRTIIGEQLFQELQFLK